MQNANAPRRKRLGCWEARGLSEGRRRYHREIRRKSSLITFFSAKIWEDDENSRKFILLLLDSLARISFQSASCTKSFHGYIFSYYQNSNCVLKTVAHLHDILPLDTSYDRGNSLTPTLFSSPTFRCALRPPPITDGLNAKLMRSLAIAKHFDNAMRERWKWEKTTEPKKRRRRRRSCLFRVARREMGAAAAA